MVEGIELDGHPALHLADQEAGTAALRAYLSSESNRQGGLTEAQVAAYIASLSPLHIRQDADFTDVGKREGTIRV